MTVIRSLLEITIYSMVLYGFIVLFKKIFRKHISPVLSYVLWFLLIARLVIPVTFDSGFTFINVPVTEQTQQNENQIIQQEILKNVYNPNTNVDTEKSSSTTTQSQKNNVDSKEYNFQPNEINSHFLKMIASLSYVDIVLGIWIFGTAISFLHILTSFFKLRKLIKHCSQPIDCDSQTMFNQIANKMGIRTSMNVVFLKGIASPAINVGINPTIILPEKLRYSLYPKQFEFAVRHELMHFKRMDYFVCFLLLLLRTIYWFNPIVWLTSKHMKLDMENACDSMVVKNHDEKYKYDYASTLINIFAYKSKPNYVLGMAMMKTKKIAEYRIRGIFMNNKSNKKVKAGAVLLTVLLLVTCFTTACQPTPVEDVVVNKGDGELENKILKSAVPAQSYNAPEAWQESFDHDQTFSVNINAQIIVPNVDRFPVQQVIPTEITQAQADQAIELFMQGQTMYKPVQHPTRDEIEEQIILIQQTLSDPNSDFNQLNKEGTSEYEQGKSEKEDQIQHLQSLLNSAPTVEEREIASSTFEKQVQEVNDAASKPDPNNPNNSNNKPDTQTISVESIRGEADLGKTVPALMSISKSPDNKTNSLQFFNCNLDAGPPYQYFKLPPAPKGVKTSQGDAQEIAENAISRIGIDNMKLSDACMGIMADNSPKGEDYNKTVLDWSQCYVFYFTRDVQGIGTTYEEETPLFGMSQYVPSDENQNIMIQPYEPEMIKISIDDSGIIEFVWQSPLTVTKTLSENVELLPFDKIQDIFKKQIVIKGAWTGEPGVINQRYNITKITLGMMRVQQKDNPNSYLMVPVWDFFGSYTRKYSEPQEGGYQLDENNEYTEEIFGHSYMTINAIDGSIIDRGLGY